MTRLQRYILNETLKALLPAFAALVLIMMAGLCMQMLHQGLDVVRMRGLLLPMFAYCVPMVLPAAFLTAVIMNFGRLAADNELIAVRAAGIHLWRLLWPVLAAGALLSVLALYFQFELNPRAHAAISALRYDAFKQILLDKVALSAKRELTFHGKTSIDIQYEDFVGGRMTNLLVVESDQTTHRPLKIMTAATATAYADPSSGKVVFDMHHCVITSFDMTRYGEANTITADEATLAPPLGDEAPNPTEDEKYMPMLPLLHYLRGMERKVSHEEKALRRSGLMPRRSQQRNPERLRRKQRGTLHTIDLEIGQLNSQLGPLKQDLDKYGLNDPAGLRQSIQRGNDALEQARTELKGLKDQQSAILQEISNMRVQQGGLVDYTRLTDLQNRQRDAQGKIDAQQQQIAKLQDELTGYQQQLAIDLDKAQKLHQQATALDKRKQKLLAQRRVPQSLATWANNQSDLNSVLIRIHKRLVQAASVFLFALIGIPLGILAGGRSVMTAFGLSFAIVLLVFYPFVIFGQVAAEAGSLPMLPAMWAGNAFVFVIGALLTAKVLRG